VLRQLSAVSTRRIEASLRRAVRGSDAHSDTALHGAHLALIALVERLPYQLAVPFEVPGFPPSDERLAEVLSAFVGATVGQLAGTSNRRSVDGNSVT
ncbi:MAG: hypothetical protein JWL70_2581, partial [Acidimicrobiia bacterium]|nr:hypothetical protein [Acidimicrobiia bacterium]